MLHGPCFCVCFAPRHRSSPPTGDVSLCLRAGRLRLLFIERIQDLLRMAFRLDARPATSDSSLGIDQERRPLYALVRLAVVRLFDPRAVALGDSVILVREQHERQPELGFETCLAARAQDTHSPDLGIADAVLGIRVTELA